MTTVVYREGVLAFDSKCTTGGTYSGWVQKGRKTDQLLMAGCGTVSEMEAVMDWIVAGAVISEAAMAKFGLWDREVDCEVIVANRDGQITIYGGRLYPIKIDGLFHALGSGAEVAIGALAAGASAERAVLIATKYDVHTGGPVRTLKFGPVQHGKKKAKVRLQSRRRRKGS